MSDDKTGRREAVLVGSPGADLRGEGEIEAAFLSWLEGGIGAVWTHLEVARIGAHEGYLADLQRGLAIIPQADGKRLARCSAPEIEVPGSDRELRWTNLFDRSSTHFYPVWTLRRVAFNQQCGAMGPYGSGRKEYTDAAGLLGDYAPIRTTVGGDAEERSDL